MSQFDEKVKIYKQQIADLKLNISDQLITAVAKGLGPSIYRGDASLVSSSDPEELKRVKERFLIGKLGLADGPKLDAAIAETVNAMGSGNRTKHRAVFYALLVQKLGKEGYYKN